MGDSDIVFDGSIPAIYDRYLVPMLFRPYAEVAAQRARTLNPSRIVETAAGTGVVTLALHQALPEAEIVATDLNQPMLDEAAHRVGAPNVRFLQADALSLPFEDGTFDLAVCQFGVMFFPDKVKGNGEARRVLRHGGTYMTLIWDTVDKNLATKIAGNAVGELFPDDAEGFYLRLPFRYHDAHLIERDMRSAGFANVTVERVELVSRAASARDAAIGLTQGTPMRTEIEKRDPAKLQAATDAAEAALRQFDGPNGFEAPMAAYLVTATK
jgi:ubiquinone/menaquinone biosynthesis C-methylase UbiE